jgi:hypothetical protein
MKRNIKSPVASSLAKVILSTLLLAPCYLALGGKTVLSQSKCKDDQFHVNYFRGLRPTGTPVISRCEKEINHNWGDEGPKVPRATPDAARSEDPDEPSEEKADTIPPEMLRDSFSAHWEGRFHFQGGTYTFHAKADDGIRLWVGGVLLINEWQTQGPTEFSKSIELAPGAYKIIVEYFENGGGAVAHVWWDSPR